VRVLFDQGTPVPLRNYLGEHKVATAAEMGWSRLSNGQLLDAAEKQFDLLITTEQSLREIGIADGVEDQVLRLAKLGVEAGIDGIVASPHEIKILRTEFGDKIKIVVQGIRPSWAEPGDQKRFMTPRAAIAAGADYIGIGRSITTHPSPREALEMIRDEIGVERCWTSVVTT
jgi:sRNA-binding carbon storage regulator CsrA